MIFPLTILFQDQERYIYRATETQVYKALNNNIYLLYQPKGSEPKEFRLNLYLLRFHHSAECAMYAVDLDPRQVESVKPLYDLSRPISNAQIPDEDLFITEQCHNVLKCQSLVNGENPYYLAYAREHRIQSAQSAFESYGSNSRYMAWHNQVLQEFRRKIDQPEALLAHPQVAFQFTRFLAERNVHHFQIVNELR